MKDLIEQRKTLINALVTILNDSTETYNTKYIVNMPIGIDQYGWISKVNKTNYRISQFSTKHGEDRFLTVVLFKFDERTSAPIKLLTFTPTEEEDIFEVTKGFETWIISGTHAEIVEEALINAGIEL